MISLIIFAAGVVLLFLSLFVVKPNTVAFIVRLGAKDRAVEEGLNFKIPFIEWVDKELTTQVFQAKETVSVKTKDNTYVHLPVRLFLQIDVNNPMAAGYNLQDPHDQIMSVAINAVKSTANKMTLQDIFEDKSEIQSEVFKELKPFTDKNGWLLSKMVIDEPMPDQHVQAASNLVIASHRELEAAKNKAEAIKTERIGEAQGDAEALRLRAEAFSNSRKIIAEGMLAAANVLKSGTKLSDGEIIEVLEGVDYRDAMITCSKHGNTIIIGGQDMKGLQAQTALNAALENHNHKAK